MKISGRKPLSGSGAVSGASRVGRPDKVEAPSAIEAATDVEISNSSREVDKAREIVAALPDVRVERIAEIKPLVEDGSYKIESQAVAKKMVDASLLESARADAKKK